MKVREVLTPLVKTALTRLCRHRDLPVHGTKGESLRRLAYSYRGDLSALVLDLRRRDLLAVPYEYSECVEFPARSTALPVSELREVFLADFEDRRGGRGRRWLPRRQGPDPAALARPTRAPLLSARERVHPHPRHSRGRPSVWTRKGEVSENCPRPQPGLPPSSRRESDPRIQPVEVMS